MDLSSKAETIARWLANGEEDVARWLASGEEAVARWLASREEAVARWPQACGCELKLSHGEKKLQLSR